MSVRIRVGFRYAVPKRHMSSSTNRAWGSCATVAMAGNCQSRLLAGFSKDHRTPASLQASGREHGQRHSIALFVPVFNTVGNAPAGA